VCSVRDLTFPASSTRVRDIQCKMSERAVQLLAIPAGEKGLHLLDIGCGTGLSGEVLSELGHTWTGVDVSPSMLQVARREGCEGDLVVNDIGEGLPFRPASFDGAVSISTVQWLCTAFRSAHNPRSRIKRFFETLFACLRKGTRAVLQLYPENKQQLDMLTMAAQRAGFSGGVVVDYPNSTRAKKMFLVLMCGASQAPAPQGLNGEEPPEGDEAAAAPRDQVQMAQRERTNNKRGGKSKRVEVKKKDWIAAKKERRRAQGKKTANDSKYSGRSRGPKF
jgi:18S rRNA (guanine1575-N7)-methyltransferase